MGQVLKVEQLLDASELEELEAFARERARTVDELHEWLLGRGFTCSRTAAWNWRQKFDEARMRERTSGAGSLAQVMLDAARESGGLQVHDAAVLQLSQLVFEAAAAKALQGELSDESLASMALAMQRLTLAKGRLELTRGEMIKQQRAALEKAEAVAEGGGSAQDVVTTVRELLGIATGGNPGTPGGGKPA